MYYRLSRANPQQAPRRTGPDEEQVFQRCFLLRHSRFQRGTCPDEERAHERSASALGLFAPNNAAEFRIPWGGHPARVHRQAPNPDTARANTGLSVVVPLGARKPLFGPRRLPLRTRSPRLRAPCALCLLRLNHDATAPAVERVTRRHDLDEGAARTRRRQRQWTKLRGAPRRRLPRTHPLTAGRRAHPARAPSNAAATTS